MLGRLAKGDTEFERLLVKGFHRSMGPEGILIQNSPSAADQERLRALAPGAVEQCRADLASWATRFTNLVWQLDPATLIAGLITRHCFIELGTYFEPAATNHPVILEIAAPLVATRPASTKPRPTSARDLLALEALYEESQHLTFLLASANSFVNPAEGRGNAAAVTGQWQYVRGSSYAPHARELTEGLFFDWSGWRSDLRFSAQHCVRFCESFLATVEDRYNEWGRTEIGRQIPKNPAARTAHFERSVLPRFVDLVSLDRDAAEQLLGSQLTTVARALLASLSIERLESGYRPLFDANPFWTKPLLVVDDRFFCVASGPMSTEMHYVLDGLQQATPAYVKRRARRVDAVALDRLKRVFLDGVAFQGLYYRDQSGRGELCELDGLLLWEDAAIVVEGKSGLISAIARRGDTERLKQEVQRLIVGARNQCARVVRLLEQPEGAIFFEEDGRTEVLRIGPGEVRRIFGVAPCFENLAGVQFDRELLPELRAGGAPFLPIYINDLGVVCDMLPHPPLLLSYLAWRARDQIHNQVLTQDELDLLGAYMFGDVVSQLEAGIEALHLANSTVSFDDYYLAEARSRPHERPRKKLTPEVERFVQLSKAERPEGWLDSCLALLELSVAEFGALAGILAKASQAVGATQCYWEAFCRTSALVLGSDVSTATVVTELRAGGPGAETLGEREDAVRVVARLREGRPEIRVAGDGDWTELNWAAV
jgi:hypothetical protein